MRSILLIAALLLNLRYIHATYFEQINTREGLIHPSVLSISQDSLGRLWFGTEQGISIFDGSRVQSYNGDDLDLGTLYSGCVVREIVNDNIGNVFLQSSSGLIKYDIAKSTFRHVFNGKVSALCSHRGSIYFVSEKKLYKWNNYNNQKVYVMDMPVNATRLIIDDNEKWAVSDKGLFYANDDFKFIHLTDIPLYSLYKSKKNEIWAGSKNFGLLRITQEHDTIVYNVHNSQILGLNSNDIREITEDKDENIWFGSFNGLYKFDLKKNRFIPYIRNNRQGALSHSSVYSVYIDKDYTLWAGTYFGGVNYTDLNQDNFIFNTASDNKNSLSHPVVGDMTEDGNHNIWICTEGGGLNMYNPADKTIRQFKSDKFPYYLPNTNLKTIVFDKQHSKFYIGTRSNSLWSYDMKTGSFHHFDKGGFSHAALSIVNVVRQREDSLFLSTDGGVFLYTLNDNKLKKIHQLNNGYASISIINGNQLWILNNRIYIYDINNLNLIEEYQCYANGVLCKPLRMIQASDGSIYIGTYNNGIIKLDPQKKTFESFPKNDPLLLNDYCYRIAETHNGNLVTIGNKGIVIFDPTGKVLQFLEAGKSIPITSFTRDCGLLVAQDGTIYAGGSNGMIGFKEKQTNPNNNTDLYFSALYIDNTLISPDDNSGILSHALYNVSSIGISYTHRKIEIPFSSKRNITQFSHYVYEYKLTGIDNAWNNITGNSIVYTKLPTGHYTLKMRNKINHNDAISLHINILPPWYFTWWAWIIWISIFIISIYATMLYLRNKARTKAIILAERVENEKIKEINEAKLKFFTSVSHEFRTPLTLITGLIEQIINTNELPASIYRKMLKVIHQSEHLNELITELIEFRKFEQDKVTLKVTPVDSTIFFQEIYDNFRIIAMQKNITFTMTDSAHHVRLFVDVHQMGKVAYNLLSNAFKYTPENGRVNMDLSMEDTIFMLRISDTGIGMKKDDLPFIFERFFQAKNNGHKDDSKYSSGIGLALVKNIVEKHKGTIKVESQPNRGSTFTVALKTGTEHFEGDEQIIVSHDEDKQDETGYISNNPEYYNNNLDYISPEENDRMQDNPVKPVILFVEDNADLLEVLKERFIAFYEVHTSCNGAEGLKKVRELKPDIVVSDIMMPEMTGIKLCDAIKKDMELCHIPVILLTALNMPEQNLNGLLHGADDYIGKPFHTQILLARCNNMIRARRLIYQQLSKQMDEDISLIATNNSDKEFLDKVTSIVEENLTNPNFNIDHIAEAMFMSRASFYSKFKELTKVTPNDFVNTYRLKKATSLLMSNDGMSISEISDALGFSSPNYFCRKFKECFNMTPTQYKKSK